MLQTLLKPDSQYPALLFLSNYIPHHMQKKSHFPIHSFYSFLKMAAWFLQSPSTSCNQLHGLSQLVEGGLSRTLNTLRKAAHVVPWTCMSRTLSRNPWLQSSAAGSFSYSKHTSLKSNCENQGSFILICCH